MDGCLGHDRHPDIECMQDAHVSWLVRHPLSMHDAWRAESAAFACKQEMQPLVQLAVLDSGNVADGVDSLLLKWGYVLNVVVPKL